MLKKRTIGIALVVVVVLSLAVVVGTTAAQGGGGRGNGRSAGGQSAANQSRSQTYQDQNCLYGCTGTGLGTAGTGTGTGSQWGGQGRGQSQLNLNNLPAAVPGVVPADVVDALEAGIMDEYNAYATYQAVIDQFGAVSPFVNIQNAEAQHIAQLQFLFDRYGLTVPAAPAAVDVPAFATLADACALGEAAEIANSALYDQWLATVQNYPDMTQVFTSLRDASLTQHLPVFERCASY